VRCGEAITQAGSGLAWSGLVSQVFGLPFLIFFILPWDSEVMVSLITHAEPYPTLYGGGYTSHIT